MRATIKLLTAIAVLFTLVAPAAEAAQAACLPGSSVGICVNIDFDPNHICYKPGVSYAPEDVCKLPVGVVNAYYNPPRPILAPRPITFTYSLRPVEGHAFGFVPVPGDRATIAAGATGGVVPVQLLPGYPLLEELARAEVRSGDGPPLVAEVLIKPRPPGQG